LTKSRNIYLKQKKAGGVKVTFQNPPKILDEKIIYNVLKVVRHLVFLVWITADVGQDYKMLNCEVLVRDENGSHSQVFA